MSELLQHDRTNARILSDAKAFIPRMPYINTVQHDGLKIWEDG